MKQIISTLLIALLSFSFSIAQNESKKEIKISKSKVIWKGFKVTGFHEGTIALQSGFLTFENEQLKGGEFVIDMKSIVCTDMSKKTRGKLEEHLKNEDFFDVEKHPTAHLVFTKVKTNAPNTYTITGNLSIKDISHPITFDALVYANKASASLKIDRAKYNVKYGSTSFFDNLKDRAIYDEFDLNISLKF